MRKIKNQEDLTFHKCRHPEACVVNVTAFITECAEGHEGPLCDSCQSGYVKDLETRQCISCEQRTWSLAFTAFSCTFIVASITAVSIQKSSRIRAKTASKDKQPRRGHENCVFDTAVFTLLDYLHIIALLRTLHIDPMGSTSRWVSQTGRMSLLNPTQEAELHCLTGFSIFARLINSMLLPGQLLVAVLFIQLAVYAFTSTEQLKFRVFKSIALPTILRVLELVYVSTTSASMTVLRTYDHPINYTDRLEADLFTENESPQHLLLFTLAVSILVCFVFGFPFGVSTWLARKAHRNFRKLRRSRRGNMKLHKRFLAILPAFSASHHGFLWPQFLMIRKVILVFTRIYSDRPLNKSTKLQEGSKNPSDSDLKEKHHDESINAEKHAGKVHKPSKEKRSHKGFKQEHIHEPKQISGRRFTPDNVSKSREATGKKGKEGSGFDPTRKSNNRRTIQKDILPNLMENHRNRLKKQMVRSKNKNKITSTKIVDVGRIKGKFLVSSLLRMSMPVWKS